MYILTGKPRFIIKNKFLKPDSIEPAPQKRKVKNKVGRPRKKVDEKLLYDLGSVGCTIDEISKIIGLSDTQIKAHYLPIIEKGRSDLKQSLRHKQVQVALTGNVSMLIWLGKQLLGQKESTQLLEHSGQFPVVVKHYGKGQAKTWENKKAVAVAKEALKDEVH